MEEVLCDRLKGRLKVNGFVLFCFFISAKPQVAGSLSVLYSCTVDPAAVETLTSL